MYVCLCHAVTDGQIRQAVADGVSSLRQVQLCLRVGTSCGKCVPATRQLVDDAKRAAADSTAATPSPVLRVVSVR